jgi:hypothetical protein
MVGAHKVLVEKPEETGTRWRPVVIGNGILNFGRCVKADLVQLAQNSSHWRVLVDVEVYFDSFLHCELSGASIRLTTRCPSNSKLDGLGTDLDPVEKRDLSFLTTVEPQFLGCPAQSLHPLCY